MSSHGLWRQAAVVAIASLLASASASAQCPPAPASGCLMGRESRLSVWNRADDAKDEVIKRRFEVYESQTYPVLEYYPKNAVVEVDAMGSPAAVLAQILNNVVHVQNEHFQRVDTSIS